MLIANALECNRFSKNWNRFPFRLAVFCNPLRKPKPVSWN